MLISSCKLYCILLVGCSEILHVQSYVNRVYPKSSRLGAAVGPDDLNGSNLRLQSTLEGRLADATLSSFKTLQKMLPALVLSGLISGICDLTALREWQTRS